MVEEEKKEEVKEEAKTEEKAEEALEAKASGSQSSEGNSRAPKEEKLEVEGARPKEEKEVKKEKHVEKKGKRVRTGRKHESVKPNSYFDIQGDKIIRKGTNCPRCGPGTLLAKHKDRQTCGRCGLTAFENTD
ncbi:MAG: 30S ribosomal protein S27ae [Candidatus Aenigmarchaeota archaeon]|nr:30S ribosomal protein S27ae [Candidatus Aenigmarchaeota archaeon]